MLLFTQGRNLENEIKLLLPEIQNDKLDRCENHRSDSQVRIVGQEYKHVLYTWDSFSPFQDAVQVTHFGTYNVETMVNKEVFCHNKRVQVTNCTINEEHTFIGFVTVEQVDMTGRQGKIQQCNVYQAFLAEIQPSRKLFSLDLQRENHLQLQFLDLGHRPKSAVNESHLLVLLHRESVGLYHVPTLTNSQGNVVLNGEPRKKQIFDSRFFWWQWEASSQRLYLAHHRKQSRSDAGKSLHQCVLTCYQFNNLIANEFKMEISLNFDIPYPKRSFRSNYYIAGPTNVVPDCAINMKVLTHPSGSLCVCYQHQPNSNSQKKQSDPTVIHYSVLLVHHGHTLNGQCSCLPKHTAETARLSFFWIGDYVVVHLPGYFTHQLNVGVNTEPSHHLLWHDEAGYSGNIPSSPVSTTATVNIRQNFTNFPLDFTGNIAVANPNVQVYNTSASTVYSVMVDRSGLVATFSSTKDTSLLEVLVLNPTQPEVLDMLQEFLIGAAFTAVQHQLSPLQLQGIAFTLGQVFRGQVHSDEQRNRLANLTYGNLGRVTFAKMVSKQQMDKRDSFWESVSRIYVKQGSNDGRTALARFNNAHVKLAADNRIAEESVTREGVGSTSASSSLLERIGTAARSAISTLGSSAKPMEEGPTSKTGAFATIDKCTSRVDRILGPAPDFLLTHHGGHMGSVQDPYIKQTVELLTRHLWRHQEGYSVRQKESKSKLRQIAEDYVICQHQQSHLLCHLIWSVLGQGQGQGQSLFFILEKYYLATEHLSFPRPPGFQLFFTSLAFSSMELRMFLQYADLGVLQISMEFASQLLQDLDDSARNVEIKLQVISRLQKEYTVACLRKWQHPIAQRYLASHYAALCLSDESALGWEMFPRIRTRATDTINLPDSRPTHSTVGATYLPVAAFVQMLESHDPGLASADSVGGLEIDSSFMEQTAMLELHSD